MIPATLNDGVTAAIADWRPRVFEAAAADFARSVVGAATPRSVTRARTLLWSCATLATFGQRVGLEPEAGVLLAPSVIERFVAVGLAHGAPSRRRAVRTNLRFVARRVGVDTGPEPAPLARSRAKVPYTGAEIEAFLALARSQPTTARRHRLAALVCLGAGAGIVGADLRGVRGTDIAARHGAIVVAVGGRAPRLVPVLARYHAPLAAAAAFAGGAYICGGASPSRRNITANLVGRVSGGADLARLEGGRLRATWIAAVAAALGLPALFAAAGVRQSQHLADVVCALGLPTEAEVVALLGGLR